MRSLRAPAPIFSGTLERTVLIAGQIVVQVVNMKSSMTGPSAASMSRSRIGRAFAFTSVTSGATYT